MNFDIFESLHLQKNEIYQIDKLQSIQNGSNGIFFTFWNQVKLISRKIWVMQK